MDKKNTYKFRITFTKMKVTKYNKKCMSKEYARNAASLHKLKGNHALDYYHCS